MTIDATRAAIQEAQEKVGLLLAARNDLLDALDEVAETFEGLHFPDTPLGRSAVTAMICSYGKAHRYVEKEGEDEPFEFGRAKDLVEELHELVKTLAREVDREPKPVPA